VAGFFIKRKLALGTNLLVIDTQSNGLDFLANKVLKATKGNSTDVLKALSTAVVKLGLAKKETCVKKEDLASLTANTSLSTDDFLDAAFVLASSERPVIVYKDGIDLTVLKVLADLVNAKLINVKGNANSLAAAQLHLEKTLKINGHKAAFYALGDSDPSQKIIKEFEKSPFKTVLASYSSSLTDIADVVLPSANWLEQEGHYVRMDGKVQEAKQAIQPNTEIWTTLKIVNKLAEKMSFRLSDDWPKELHKRVSMVEISE
jgi:predicted molibdopterin-dependent oxidoreductase YjgC